MLQMLLLFREKWSTFCNPLGDIFLDKSENQKIKEQYDNIANRYDAVDWFIPDSWRKKATGLAYGHILEVGVGTGLNLPFYSDRGQKILGIDLSPRMLEHAAERALHCKAEVELAVMDVQDLPIESGSFDCVLVSFVLCTVPDPAQALRECHRVLQSGGRLILLEHMGSDNSILQKIMDWVNPLTVKLIGDHINRQTVGLVVSAGFKPMSVENLFGDVVRLIVAER
jgi:ubiquinone/menaquinone biosynthesis C-methylase UbiE